MNIIDPTYLKKEKIIIILRNKFPQVNSERHSELIASNWVQIREPQKFVSAVLAAVPLMNLSALVSFIILDFFSPFSLEEFGIDLSQGVKIAIYLLDVIYFIGLSIVVVSFHELIHLVFVPDFLDSDKTFLRFTFFGGFVYSEEIMSKSRFCLSLLAPFVVISIVLPVILGTLNLLSPLAKFIILSNAIGSGVDILGLILVMIQIPSGANVTNNGIRTYWKTIDHSIPAST